MSTTKKEDDTVRVRPFADVLQEIDRGKFHAEVSEALHELTSHVEDTRKGGEVLLVIKVQPMKKNADVLEVVADVRTKLPRNERKASIFFADREGNLTRTDPNQPELFQGIREVPTASTEAEKTEKHA